MKRKHSYLSNTELLQIGVISTRINLAGMSWLEALAKISDGVLLAKIVYKLEKRDLFSMRCTSTTIQNVCDRYQMIERLHTDFVYIFGRLGDYCVGIPKQIQGIPKVATISCGLNHTGILTVDGNVYMFGSGPYGVLGDGDSTFDTISAPRQIQGVPKVAAISCGGLHTGILTSSGDVYMFGLGDYGNLGDGDTTAHRVGVPTKIQNIPKVAALSCGDLHTGIVTTHGDVYMFGNGKSGRLGDNDTGIHRVGIPRQIQGIPKVATISCGWIHTGILTVDGNVCMFGNGAYGKLGDGDISDHNVGIPSKIQNIPKVASISCAAFHTGIVTIDGDIYMFGNGGYGQLGDNNTNNHSVGIPRQIQDIPKVAVVSCFGTHTGILTIDKDIYMFGNAEYGKLGDGDCGGHRVGIPRKIQGIPKIASISCGITHTGIVTVAESTLNLTF